MTDWISVEDEMPPPMTDVLICQQYAHNGVKVRLVGKWIPSLTEVAGSDVDDWHEYDEGTDEYYVPEGWYENQHNWGEFASIHAPSELITHWMPLPETPK